MTQLDANLPIVCGHVLGRGPKGGSAGSLNRFDTTGYLGRLSRLPRFCCPEGEQVFADLGRSWVVAGGPDSAEARAQVMSLVDAARRRNVRPVFFALDPSLARSAGLRTVPAGVEWLWQPQQWNRLVAGNTSLRVQVARARKKGVAVQWLHSRADALRMHTQFSGLVAAWLDALPMPLMGFVLRHPLVAWADCSYRLVASLRGRWVAALLVHEVRDRLSGQVGGVFIEHAVRCSGAPVGTIEALFGDLMVRAHRQGVPQVSWGLTPLAGHLPPWMAMARNFGEGLYRFGGLERFRTKLRPTSALPKVIAFPQEVFSVVAVRSVLQAFSGGDTLRFARQLVVSRLQRHLVAHRRLVTRARPHFSVPTRVRG